MSCNIKKKIGYNKFIDKAIKEVGVSGEVQKVYTELHTAGFDSYKNMLVDLTKQVNDPEVRVARIQLAIRRMLEHGTIAMASYDPKYNVINLMPKDADIRGKMKTLVFARAQIENGRTVKMFENKEERAMTKKMFGLTEAEESVVELMRDAIESGYESMVLHEYIHAGAYTYMRSNPESRETKEVERMYKVAMENAENIDTRVLNEYWKKNTDEFISEALSNPQLISALDDLKDDGRSMMRKLLDTVLSMLGIKEESPTSLYKGVLKSYVSMLNAQKQAENVKEDTIENIQNTEVANMLFKEASKCKNGM
jgi:hypothetical protein